MRGVVFNGDRELEIMTFPDPTPGPGEVVLEMKASGMCGSDLKQYRRPKGVRQGMGLAAAVGPTIVGHEPCGVVAAIGPGVDPRVAQEGARVMVHHYQGCTTCGHCRTGWQQLCQKTSVKVYGNNSHGGHAQYMCVPANTLVPLAEELSFTAGAAISCGTGTAYGALRRLNVSGNDTIAIFGQGPVGLSATQLATAMGARVIALDISPQRLQRAKEFGAAETINPSNVDAVEAIRELTHGLGADLTLKVWGTCCFVGEGGEVTIDVSPDMLRRQATVIASWTFSTVGQADCAQFIIDRGIKVDDLFTETWTLDQAEQAYTLFDQQNTGKGVFLI